MINIRQLASIAFVILLSISSVQAKQSNVNEKDCYPITSADLVRKGAPRFKQYPAKIEKQKHSPRLDLKSNPEAKTYRTVLRKGIAEGPNFAGHYTVVGWGCGSSCVQFAIVNINTGKVIFPSKFSAVSGVDLEANDFEPYTLHQFWGLRYKLNSRLLIVLGALDEDENKQVAFYFVMGNDNLKPLYSVLVKKRRCE